MVKLKWLWTVTHQTLTPNILKNIGRRFLFFFSECYLLAPLPGRLVDFEYKISISLANIIHERTKVDFGPSPYPYIKDDIFFLLLLFTSLTLTVIFMFVIEKFFIFLWKTFKRHI